MYRTIKTVLFVTLFSTTLGDKRCNFTSLYDQECSPNESCDESNTCQCLPDYELKDNICVHKVNLDASSANYSDLVDNQGSGSVAAGILVPLFLIVFVMCGVYLSRKYHLVPWFRNRFLRRNENYDEFMIGNDLDDDDEPLQ